eukprot:4195936-Lingulodinium_polyedra.AAC.1
MFSGVWFMRRSLTAARQCLCEYSRVQPWGDASARRGPQAFRLVAIAMGWATTCVSWGLAAKKPFHIYASVFVCILVSIAILVRSFAPAGIPKPGVWLSPPLTLQLWTVQGASRLSGGG